MPPRALFRKFSSQDLTGKLSFSIFRYMSKYRTKKIGDYTRMFAALGNLHRASILLQLADCGCSDPDSCSRDEMRTCVGDVARNLNIAASTVSHHIKELNQAGLIKMERRGRTVKCCVDTSAVLELADFLGHATGPAPVRARRKPK